MCKIKGITAHSRNPFKIVKRIVQTTIILLSIILLAGCYASHGIVLTEEELFAILERDFPGREFEIVRIFGPSRGLGVDAVANRHFTVRCLYTGIEFRTMGTDFDNMQYLNALWGRAAQNWQQEFQDSFYEMMYELDAIHPMLSFRIGGSLDEWSSPIFTPSDFAFITNVSIAEPRLEEILKVFDDFEKPIYMSINLSYRVHVYEFDKESTVEEIKNIFGRFVMPLYRRMDNWQNLDINLTLSCRFHYRVIHSDPEAAGWQRDIHFRLQTESLLELRELLENLDRYDFAEYFSGL